MVREEGKGGPEAFFTPTASEVFWVMSHYELNKTANHLNMTNIREMGYAEIQSADSEYSK